MSRFAIILLIFFSFSVLLQAQDGKDSVIVPADAEMLFKSFIEKKDTALQEDFLRYTKDRFVKRFSFHTNLVGWALLLPNISVEMDLSQKPRTHYSVLLHGMLNGKAKTTFGTSFVFNVRSVSVEGRKYWRTGKRGARRYHTEYVRLHTRNPYVELRDDSTNKMVRTPHYTGKDSVIAERYNGNPYQGWLYNTYHRIRRNVFSGRTVERPRDWRAYYVGLFAGIDDWSIAFSGDGRQGEGVFAGISAGWSIPLFPQKFPREGSLDLELGIGVAAKAVKYRAYTREPETGHYLLDVANSKESWHICPYPVVQDVHVSLVWRFRGIKHKVDRSLIDDYENQILAFTNSKDSLYKRLDEQREEKKQQAAAARARASHVADSTSYADNYHRRRLINAKTINPDTVFVGEDLDLYYRLVEGINISSKKGITKHKENVVKRDKDAARMLEARKKKKQKDSDKKEPVNAQEVAPKAEPVQPAEKSEDVPKTEPAQSTESPQDEMPKQNE